MYTCMYMLTVVKVENLKSGTGFSDFFAPSGGNYREFLGDFSL